jgi:hypothetical protein
MLSALSVLALLLAADGTPAQKPSPVEVTALAVDVDFLCPTRSTQSLILLPKAQGQLDVPQSCPEAGADWRLSVECTPKRCSGYVRATAGAIALVQGSRQQLTLKPIAEQHPPTLDLMVLRITGEHTLQLESSEEHHPPVQLLLRLPTVTGIYTLAPSASERIPVDFESQGKRVTLQALVSRTDDSHVRLQLWNARNESLLDETLKLEETRELDCKRLDGFCTGSVKVWVREYQRVL